MRLSSRSTRNLLPTINHLNFPMETSSPSRTKDSEVPNSYSNPVSLILKAQEFTNLPSNLSWNVIWISEGTCNLNFLYLVTETSLCQVEQPCSQEFPKDWAKKSPHLLLQPWRSRLLLPLRENSLYGSEDQSSLPSPPSKQCGSPEQSMMNQAPA